MGNCPSSDTGTQCNSAPTVSFGATLSYSSGSEFGPWESGTKASMTCPFGQSVIGPSTSTCINGIWSMLGTCSSSGMNTPCYFGLLNPPNGFITYSEPTPPYASGTVATLTCNAGFIVIGPNNAVCTNGSFTMIGTCRQF
ncbi:sushi domain protein [Dictyocaulus viviparus]|uniref:Sushi domain protein n=1 Tax=Dictyocaulus viviparus TaxID=29172 RepID=A0A0D8XR06_DICVI|nr:sushi domain protein [Dictyocaulus viviparus]